MHRGWQNARGILLTPADRIANLVTRPVDVGVQNSLRLRRVRHPWLRVCPMWRCDQLDADLACVALIDLQEKLLPLIPDGQRIVRATTRLLHGAAIFNVPVLVTEQYPKGLGRTVGEIGSACPPTRLVVEKPTFSAWAHSPVRDALRSIDRPQVILAGVETHICILQTALDLRSRDFGVFVVADGVGSRGAFDHEVALDRLRQEGVIVTTVESVLFELCGRCDTPAFRRMIEIIKAHPPEA